jgi:hypothetical protein
VQIFNSKSRTRWNLGCHQIWVFRHHSEQLIGREARRELEEASAHVLGAEASPEAALTVTKHRPSRLTVAGLCCHPPPIKVSLIKFPSSLWSHRSKPHRKPTTVVRENPNSGEPPHSAVTCHREHEPVPPPAEASRPSCRSGSQRPTFNEVRGPVSRRRWTRSTVPWTYSTDFS